MGPLCPCPNSKKPMKKTTECIMVTTHQGRTDNSWGPRAIGDHGAPAGADWQLMGPPGNRGSWGPCVLAQTQKSL
ncbi:unnamed protein product [Staurois parvus]|uniref:Uncharacterized protein n=1 Tax=Staurois parvus TaxID=386267 RepID=A0ABN9FFA4_9NEOB|nr:unnamed protein product [Staurois parvus]